MMRATILPNKNNEMKGEVLKQYLLSTKNSFFWLSDNQDRFFKDIGGFSLPSSNHPYVLDERKICIDYTVSYIVSKEKLNSINKDDVMLALIAFYERNIKSKVDESGLKLEDSNERSFEGKYTIDGITGNGIIKLTFHLYK